MIRLIIYLCNTDNGIKDYGGNMFINEVTDLIQTENLYE
jgi:hypothetical protein